MGKGRRYQDSRKANIILSIIEIILFFLIIYNGYKIVFWLKDNNSSKKIMTDISDEISSISEEIENVEQIDEFQIHFSNLKNKNDDTIGVLKLKGIDIEYPVVKSTDNDYYLSHSFDKSINGAGWIFADFRNKLDGNDKNIVIYGHNRRDGSMFGTLKKVLTEEWYSNEENTKIFFATENEKSIYQVFSIYKIEVEDYYITTDFLDNEYEEFLNKVKNRSIHDFGIEVGKEDKILTLSTCDNNNKYRVAVHSKKIF